MIEERLALYATSLGILTYVATGVPGQGGVDTVLHDLPDLPDVLTAVYPVAPSPLYALHALDEAGVQFISRGARDDAITPREKVQEIADKLVGRTHVTLDPGGTDTLATAILGGAAGIVDLGHDERSRPRWSVTLTIRYVNPEAVTAAVREA